jgi:hypothetical protein
MLNTKTIENNGDKTTTKKTKINIKTIGLIIKKEGMKLSLQTIILRMEYIGTNKGLKRMIKKILAKKNQVAEKFLLNSQKEAIVTTH